MRGGVGLKLLFDQRHRHAWGAAFRSTLWTRLKRRARQTWTMRTCSTDQNPCDQRNLAVRAVQIVVLLPTA